MKCPKDLRQCPHSWTDCSLCAHKPQCDNGTYVPEPEKIETDIEVVIKAAEVSEKVVNDGVRESVEKIRGTWSERFSQMTEDERWTEHGRYQVPNIHAKEPYKAMSGPTEPGGSTMKCKKETKGTKPTIYKWGEFK